MLKHIATIEIPVSNLERSIGWYTTHLELTCVFKGEKNAMLSFHNSSPTIFLVETETVHSHSFSNMNTGIEHSMIDFFADDLEKAHGELRSKGVKTGELNLMNGGFGGFGFYDPDGHLLSATNVLHEGQEAFKETKSREEA
ncbi:VOC family protein [Bacillus sp. H-16]|uniref:VOC family protein n=1 Tax=Alteribacter salitolerans TaxID=2912333 RepID=UPI001963A81B|nr:VOC family protein [Alteribacter salitolerans]MBM7095111.1 VOC family protein [Alteribacter salitolerans]